MLRVLNGTPCEMVKWQRAQPPSENDALFNGTLGALFMRAHHKYTVLFHKKKKRRKKKWKTQTEESIIILNLILYQTIRHLQHMGSNKKTWYATKKNERKKGRKKEKRQVHCMSDERKQKTGGTRAQERAVVIRRKGRGVSSLTSSVRLSCCCCLVFFFFAYAHCALKPMLMPFFSTCFPLIFHSLLDSLFFFLLFNCAAAHHANCARYSPYSAPTIDLLIIAALFSFLFSFLFWLILLVLWCRARQTLPFQNTRSY